MLWLQWGVTVKKFKHLSLISFSILILSILLYSAPLGSPVFANSTVDDWPMFRHDLANTGYSTSVNPPTSANLLWNYTTGHVIWASPTVSDGKVYIPSDDGNLYCFDALSGEKIWNYTTTGSINSSPAVAGGYVYVGSWDGIFYCIDADTGEKVWSYVTGSYLNSSPAIVDNIVYVGSWDHNIYAFGTPSQTSTPSPTVSPSSTVPEFPLPIAVTLAAVILAISLIVGKYRNKNRTAHKRN